MLAYITEVSMTNFKLSLVGAKTIVFKKAQKKTVKIGAEKVQKQKQAMWSALTGAAARKCSLAVTLCAGMFHGAIGHSTSFFDSGAGAVKCDDAGITKLNEVVEKKFPSVIFINAPLDTDADNSAGSEHLKNFAETHERAGRMCITADTRHTARWNTKQFLC